jgi:hypothetical protein
MILVGGGTSQHPSCSRLKRRATVSEPSVTKHRRYKAGENSLEKHCREIGIKAVAAAAKSRNKNVAGARLDQTQQGERPMNEHEQSRRFADKNTRVARETIERSVSAAEEGIKGAEQRLSSSLASLRELNIKLIDMAHANADEVFDLAHDVASAQAPSDLAAIWSAHAKRQFEMMTTQTRELTAMGQKLAARSTEPLTRSG